VFYWNECPISKIHVAQHAKKQKLTLTALRGSALPVTDELSFEERADEPKIPIHKVSPRKKGEKGRPADPHACQLSGR
jgi:hypothetical protein